MEQLTSLTKLKDNSILYNFGSSFMANPFQAISTNIKKTAHSVIKPFRSKAKRQDDKKTGYDHALDPFRQAIGVGQNLESRAQLNQVPKNNIVNRLPKSLSPNSATAQQNMQQLRDQNTQQNQQTAAQELQSRRQLLQSQAIQQRASF